MTDQIDSAFDAMDAHAMDVAAEAKKRFDEQIEHHRYRDALYVAHEFISSARTWDGSQEDQEEALAEIERTLGGGDRITGLRALEEHRA